MHSRAHHRRLLRSLFKAGFADLVYVEGKTIIFEERYPAEQKERFDTYAAELVAPGVDALIAGSIPGGLCRSSARFPFRAKQTPGYGRKRSILFSRSCRIRIAVGTL